MAEPAYLYVIGAQSGPLKVGLSVSPRRRLSQLQNGSHQRLEIKRTSPSPAADADKVEAYAKWLLREARVRGEWFRVTEEAAWVALTAAAEAVAAGKSIPVPPKPEPKKRGRPLHQHEPVLIRFVPGTKERN